MKRKKIILSNAVFYFTLISSPIINGYAYSIKNESGKFVNEISFFDLGGTEITYKGEGRIKLVGRLNNGETRTFNPKFNRDIHSIKIVSDPNVVETKGIWRGNQNFIIRPDLKVATYADIESICPLKGVKLYVTNRIPNINFKIGVGADSECGFKGWNTFEGPGSIPGGKLTQAQGSALEIRSCHKGVWRNVFVDVINKNNKYKKVNIPLDFPPYSWTGQDNETCYWPNNVVIIFKKNNAGKVEISRARLDRQSNFKDEIIVTTLEPSDYE